MFIIFKYVYTNIKDKYISIRIVFVPVTSVEKTLLAFNLCQRSIKCKCMGLLIFLDSVFCSIDFLCLLTPILLTVTLSCKQCTMWLTVTYILETGRSSPIETHSLFFISCICVDLWLLWLICDRRVSMCLLRLSQKSYSSLFGLLECSLWNKPGNI